MRDARRTMIAATLAGALFAAGCTATPDEKREASGVRVSGQWASAADMGMAAVFGTVTNDGGGEVRIVAGSSPAAGRVEVHEVVSDADGSNVMRPKAGGIAVGPGQSHDLRPGGDHVMLMELTRPLQPGADVEVTLAFDDGSTLPVTAQVRDFPGADEEYHPTVHHG